MRKRLARILDAILGPHCGQGCGQRVYPRDEATHTEIDHAGDPT